MKMPKYVAVLNKQVVKTFDAPDIAAAKKEARAEFGKKVIVALESAWAHLSSPEFAEKVRGRK